MLPQQYAKMLYAITIDLNEREYSHAIDVFIIYLQQQQVISKLPYIIEEFVHYAKKKDGIQELSMSSARPLTEKQVEEIASTFGEKPEVQTTVDESLVGGVVVRTNEIIFDGSMKTQLEKLKASLTS